MKRKSQLILATMAAAFGGFGYPNTLLVDDSRISKPEQPPLSKHDLEAIERAKAKRARKAATKKERK